MRTREPSQTNATISIMKGIAIISVVTSNAHLYDFPTIETNNIWWVTFYIVTGVTLPLLVSKHYIRTIESIKERIKSINN